MSPRRFAAGSAASAEAITDATTTGHAPAEAIINLDHSSYQTTGTMQEGGTTQVNVDATDVHHAAKFVNAGAGDFRERASSPTVDAGKTTSEAGTTDLAGGPRRLGPHTDIGAFELPERPMLNTFKVTAVTRHTVHVSVRVHGERLHTSAYLVLVRNGVHHKSAENTVSASAVTKTLHFTVSGLGRHRTYRAYVVARNTAGSATSKVRHPHTH